MVNQILKNKAFGKDDEAREKLLKEGGLKIVTTLDRNANNAAMQAANSTVPATDPSGFEVMIAAVKPGTGEILSFGINRTYDATDDARTDETKTSMNYMVDQEDGGGMGFNVGSTWKPINMVAWMQKGHSINESLVTSTVYDTSKFNCNGYGFVGPWRVQNSGGGTTSGKPAAGSDQVAQHHAGLDGVEHRSVRDRRRGQGDGLPQRHLQRVRHLLR